VRLIPSGFDLRRELATRDGVNGLVLEVSLNEVTGIKEIKEVKEKRDRLRRGEGAGYFD